MTPPLPDPLPPEVMLIQGTLVDALQLPLQPDGDPLIATDPGPPEAFAEADRGETE